MALTTVPASLSATALTLTTAAQPNITSVGTLTGLTVSGNIAGTLTTAAQTNITSVGTLSSLTVSGFAKADNYQFYQNSSASGASDAIYRKTTATLAFKTGSGERMTLDGSGNLVVTGGITSSGQIKSQNDFVLADSGGTNRGFVFGTANGVFARFNSGLNFQVQEAGSTRFTIASGGNATFSGNVGVKVPSLLAFRTNSNEGAIQIGKRGVIFADTGITTHLGNNTYITSANQRVAIENDYGSFYEQYQGKHTFYTTTQAETANSLQTFTTTLQMLQNGDVGIGDATPRVKLEVHGGPNKGIILKPNAQIAYSPSSTDFYNGLTFENSGSGHAYSIGYGQGGRIKFSYFDNSSTYEELAHIRPGGDFYPAGSVVLQSGEGINFSATANTSASGATMSSELLDDYEEGTWTPGVGGSSGGACTMGSGNLGRYVKVGAKVTVNGTVHIASVPTLSGSIILTGLPFPTRAQVHYRSNAAPVTNTAITPGTNMTMLGIGVDQNLSYAWIVGMNPSTKTYTHYPTVGTGHLYGFSMTYFTDS